MWKAYKSRWPNGREYWTVENRKDGLHRIGPNGGVTIYYDHEAAKAERDRLNGKPPRDTGPVLIESAP